MPLKSNDIAALRPLWLRVLIAIALFVWCAAEWLWNNDPFWGVLVGAVLIYFLYNYIYAFPKEIPADEPPQPNEPPRPPQGPDGPGA